MEASVASPELDEVAELEGAAAAPGTGGAPPITEYMRPRDFWRATKAYGPRAGCDYHLYRRWPVIDRKLAGHEKRVLDVQPEMDERYVLEHWGSGEYRIYFHDVNRKGNTQVCHTVVRLQHDDKPPIVDQAELVVGHPRNIGFIEGLKARGRWKEDMNGKGESAAVAAEVVGLAKEVIQQHSRAPAPQTAGVTETLAMMAEGFKTVLQQALNPLDQLAKAKELLSSEPSSGFMGLVTETLKQNNALMLKFMESRQAAAAAPAPSLVEQANQFLDLGDRLMDRYMSQRTVTDSPWANVLAELARAFAPAIAAVAMAKFRPSAAAEVAAPAAARPSLPANLPPVAAPPPAAVHADPARLKGLPIMSSEIPGSPLGMQTMVVVAQEAVQAFQIGVTGDSYADAVVRKYGEPVYEAIALLGRDAILQAIRFYPEVQQLIGQRMVEVEQFVDDFLAYGREPEGDAGEVKPS